MEFSFYSNALRDILHNEESCYLGDRANDYENPVLHDDVGACGNTSIFTSLNLSNHVENYDGSENRLNHAHRRIGISAGFAAAGHKVHLFLRCSLFTILKVLAIFFLALAAVLPNSP